MGNVTWFRIMMPLGKKEKKNWRIVISNAASWTKKEMHQKLDY